MFSEDVYTELKQGLKTDLPEDYIAFLRTYDGNVPEANSFSVVPNDWGSGIDELYLMQRAGDHQSLLRGLHWEGIPLKPGLFPIGGDGAFGYILISLRPQDRGSIHFCCTWSEDGKTDVYESQGYWRIADSFTAFVSSLTKDTEEP